MTKKKEEPEKESKNEPESETSQEGSELEEEEVEEIEQEIDTTNFQQFMRPTQRVVSSLGKIQTISEPVQLEEQIIQTPKPEEPTNYSEIAEKYETGGKYDIENPGLEPANLGRSQSQTSLLSPESGAEFIGQNQSPETLSNIKVQQQGSRLPFEQEERKYKRPGM
jgi:DNA-binding protein H-NS